MKGKKGFDTSTVIISMILLIIAFAIILVFFLKTSASGIGEDSVCKLSVLTRATVFSEAKNEIPLKCSTQKLCLTSRLFGGECKQFIGEKMVETERISNSDDLEEVIAGSMFNCWNTYGKGKLDLFSNKELSNIFISNWLTNLFSQGKEKYPLCRICARIALDDNSRKFLTGVDLADYLESHQTPDNSGLTYLQSFTDKQVKLIPNEVKNQYKSGLNGNIDELGIIFMQVLSENDPNIGAGIFNAEDAEKGATAAGALIIGAFILTPFGIPFGITGALAIILGAGGTAGFASAANQNTNSAIATTYCGQMISTKGDEGDEIYGCSLLKVIDFDNIKQLNELCRNPEALYE